MAGEGSDLLRVGFYDIERTIGRGNFALVKLARHRVTKSEVAIKVVDKTRLDADSLSKVYREIDVLKTLNHPFIIKLYQVMETENLLYIVTEYAPNGEVFDSIQRQRRLTESDARYKFWQILSAVEYCHEKGIVHRDLKAENLLIDGYGKLKIADFGFSNFFKKDELLSTFCGSPPYAAPEVFEGHNYQGPKIDIWSLGVVLYVMVCGALPFEGGNLQQLRDRVLGGRFRIPYYMSSDCENLIRRMLTVDPAKRPTIQQIRKHRWMQAENMEHRIRNEIRVYEKLEECEPQQQMISMMVNWGMHANHVKQSLSSRAFDHPMAIYLLLFERWRNSMMKTEFIRAHCEQEQEKEAATRKQRAPRLNSTRHHSVFTTTDTGCSVTSQCDDEVIAARPILSRQSTVGTTASIDEGVETDTHSPPTQTGFMLEGFTRFEEKVSAEKTAEDPMSSLASCPADQDQEPSTSTSTTTNSFGDGWRASDNAMHKSVHGRFPTGKLQRENTELGEFPKPQPPPGFFEETMQKMRISRRSPEKKKLPKRVSLPENLEFQPHKLLNMKQSLVVEAHLDGHTPATDKPYDTLRQRMRIKNGKKNRQLAFQCQQKPGLLRAAEDAGFLSPIEDDMDTA